VRPQALGVTPARKFATEPLPEQGRSEDLCSARNPRGWTTMKLQVGQEARENYVGHHDDDDEASLAFRASLRS
jgi:hypothetical protein